MAVSTISITFESLLETISNLGQVEKRKLWEYLDSELSEEELDEQTIGYGSIINIRVSANKQSIDGDSRFRYPIAS